MNRKSLLSAVAEDMLEGVGLDFSLIQIDALIKAERSKGDKASDDALESYYEIRKNLRRLKDQQ